MEWETNGLGQPIGFSVPAWTPPPAPSRDPMEGRYCRVEFLDPEIHADDLFAANAADPEGRIWTYLPYGPFPDFVSYADWLKAASGKDDPAFYAIRDLSSGRAVGVASYLRVDRPHGAIEVGHINYSPELQRTRAGTEAMFLMMERVFESGYRRYEWKCNALNEPSRRAAQRLGFSYESVFRQAAVVKGRNRDTAWYAAIDSEWPALRDAFRRWLSPSNFTPTGAQQVSLTDLTAPILKCRG